MKPGKAKIDKNTSKKSRSKPAEEAAATLPLKQENAEPTAPTVDWKGGTYNKLLSAMRSQNQSTSALNPDAVMHSKPFQKSQTDPPAVSENKPKTRFDPSSTR